MCAWWFWNRPCAYNKEHNMSDVANIGATVTNHTVTTSPPTLKSVHNGSPKELPTLPHGNKEAAKQTTTEPTANHLVFKQLTPNTPSTTISAQDTHHVHPKIVTTDSTTVKSHVQASPDTNPSPAPQPVATPVASTAPKETTNSVPATNDNNTSGTSVYSAIASASSSTIRGSTLNIQA